MSRTLTLTLTVAILAVALPSGIKLAAGAPQASASQPSPLSDTVVARGRIEPLGGVAAVSGPPESMSTVAIVDKLLVEQGSRVQPGQVLAVLNGYDLSTADLEVSLANLRLARLQRLQLQSGAGKTADIAAEANVLAARRAQLVKAGKDLNRASMLVESKSASTQLLDTQRAAFDQATQEVQQAENAIKALTEVRPVDDNVAAGQVEVAEANVARARAAIDRLQIRARQPGTVLSIQTRAGEAVSGDGILRFGDLDHLIVVAEIDESQMSRIKLGMVASIESPVLSGSVPGTVSKIANETQRQRRPSSDILVGRDARIVEVEITPSKPLPNVIGAEVTVRLTAPASAS